jgi:uncharacterized protein
MNLSGGLRAAAAALFLLAATGDALAADKPLELAWEQLIPARAGAGKPAPPPAWGMVYDWTIPDNLPEPIGRQWREDLTLLVHDLDGKRVRIPGFVVPVGLVGQTVTEFLLVPYYGACIHVPPPPPNQIVLVRLAKGVAVGSDFVPVFVTGVMSTGRLSTELADVGYQITAGVVEPYRSGAP